MSSPITTSRRALGRYVLGPAIGRGATSVVHRADDIVTGDAVAVKVVPVELDLAARVGAEVRAAGRLDHPRIVALLDWGEDSECLYLVWELVERNELTAIMETARETMGLRMAQELFADVENPGEVGAVSALLGAAVTYLAIRQRKIRWFNGIDLRADEGWEKIRQAVLMMTAGLNPSN